jgi:hypothetical protein
LCFVEPLHRDIPTIAGYGTIGHGLPFNQCSAS